MFALSTFVVALAASIAAAPTQHNSTLVRRLDPNRKVGLAWSTNPGANDINAIRFWGGGKVGG